MPRKKKLVEEGEVVKPVEREELKPKPKYYVKGKVVGVSVAPSYMELTVNYKVEPVDGGEGKEFTDIIFLTRDEFSIDKLKEKVAELGRMRVEGEYEQDKLASGLEFEAEAY
jgi:hypothetical protein